MKETRAAGKAIGVKDMGQYERVTYIYVSVTYAMCRSEWNYAATGVAN
jgi:hypothetical protein